MGAAVEVVVPDNEEGTKATVLRWCKAPGDRVLKDEPLLELETDKVTVEVPAPAAGELAEILKQPNEEVLPGQVLARIRSADSAGAGATGTGVGGATEPMPSTAPGTAAGGESHVPASGAENDAENGADGRSLVSPAVRRLLSEHRLSLSDVEGSGRGGRVTAQDVTRHVSVARDLGASRAVAAREAPNVGTVPEVRETPNAGAVPGGRDTSGSRGKAGADPGAAPRASAAEPSRARASDGTASVRVPHTPVRRRVAEHMAKSLAQAPHVTTVFEADLGRVQAHRARHAAEFERQGARLTYTAYFVAACARALMAHPSVNSTFHEDALEMHAHANIGVGTALGNEGLIVPVLHNAETMSLLGVARRLGTLVAAARAGKLAPQDVRGGTFTISNHGVGGSLLAAPIVINQPQVAILGVGKVERRPCVIDVPGGGEALAVRTMCYLTLTLDHRALDAFQANAFLAQVVSTLESWEES
jgi:2-oxoglutarate dehydrogenase E2 component (dihydrolipoamide succinyltransferase)